VTDKTGSAINEGSSTTITFANGISSAGGLLTAYTAETATLTATDGTLSTSSTGGTGVSLTVAPAAATHLAISAPASVTAGSAAISVGTAGTDATHFAVSAPSSVTAGSAFSFAVTALGQFNVAATGYTGTVHFTTTDNGTGVVVPMDYTFMAGENGSHTFTNG